MLTKLPNGLSAFPVIGAGIFDAFSGARENIYYVDGDMGSDGNDGKDPEAAKATIQSAVTAAAARNVTLKCGSIIYVKTKYMAAGSTDPASYAETVIVPAAGGDRMALIGVSGGRVQGALPQIKKGSGTTGLLTLRAPGCLVANIGFNGIWTADSTQSLKGIILDDDGSTKTAFGTTIYNCHFKNCAGSTASTNAAVGGAINWASTGGAWQVLIKGCRFYKNVGDIVLLGTTASVPQDVIIEDNIFSGPAANTDCNLYLAGGSGMNGVIIRNNVFTAFPAMGGTNSLFMDLTGCVGALTGNYFCANGKTFKAAGSGAFVPTTVLMAGNYQEVTSSGGTSAGEFGRAS